MSYVHVNRNLLSASGSGVLCMDIFERILVCAGGDNKISLWNVTDNDATGKDKFIV